MVRYFKSQLTELHVTVRFGKGVDLFTIKEIKPDVIILATGGVGDIPGIPGIDHRKVVNSATFHGKLKTVLRFFGPKTLERLTKWWMPIGKRVVIIGGAMQGCQLAEFLVKRGRKVVITETTERLGEGLPDHSAIRLFKWLDEKSMIMMTRVKYEEITDEGLVVTTKEGEKKTLTADTMITALPLLPDDSLFKIYKGEAPEIYEIGDSREFGLMYDAIADGSRIAGDI
jgi:2,4-dienoyl-CoA reductase (NADPH2)